MLLGDRAPPAERERFGRAISTRRRYQELLLGSVLPFASLMPGGVGRDYARAQQDIDTIVRSAIARSRAESAQSGDLISMLTHATYEDGTGMDDEQILDEARTLTLAGYETMAEALTWTWYLLATAPAVASMLEAELGTLGGGRARDVADLRRLTYTRMVLAESMRLYPPTWLFVRCARGDDVLPSGAHIPAGAKIYLSQWVMHRNPLYFPDPERFDPLRFTDEAIKARPRFTYLPFGTGRRLCIGEELAWMQGVLLIASIARRFRLELVPGHTVIAEPNVTLRPKGGMPMRLIAR
jgi:cytochrome P450